MGDSGDKRSTRRVPLVLWTSCSRLEVDPESIMAVLNQRVPIDIPIGANIPIALDINVPVSYEIPVETDIPVNFIVDVPVETNVPIETEVPVKLDFPVNVPMQDLEINRFLDELRKGLEELARILGA